MLGGESDVGFGASGANWNGWITTQCGRQIDHFVGWGCGGKVGVGQSNVAQIHDFAEGDFVGSESCLGGRGDGDGGGGGNGGGDG